MSFLELVDLTKNYGGRAAVDRVSLAIEKGSLVSLLGPSGCGKTTTLRLIAGFISPDEGSIRVGGQTIARSGSSLPPERRDMAMIFQSYALWPHMTVAQNITYGLEIRKLGREERQRRLATILELTKLTPYADRYPGALSGGQQQRVSLARALVVEPSILLLDEPLSNLDANLREEMRFEIRRLHDEQHCTTVYVTHDQAEAMSTADLIVVMNGGQIDQVGTPEDIYERPTSEFVARFIGGTNVLKGRRMNGNAIDVGGGLVLECGSGEFANDGQAAVSIRQQAVRLTVTAPADQRNSTPAKVTRQVYLGTHRDYLAELPTGQSVRALTTPDVSIPRGTDVWVHFPSEHCRGLAR